MVEYLIGQIASELLVGLNEELQVETRHRSRTFFVEFEDLALDQREHTTRSANFALMARGNLTKS